MSDNKNATQEAPSNTSGAIAAPAKNTEFKTYLIKIQQKYTDMVEKQFIENRLILKPYSKECILNAIFAIQEMMDKNKAKVSFMDPDFDQTSLTGILRRVASLQLNASATPREVYFTIRSENRGKAGADNWVKKVEMGIEGDGNDALLRNFGVGVAVVYPVWVVREGDLFEYPKHVGLESTPPAWTGGGKGICTKVVYPIRLTDGTAAFLISEREDVRPNLLAHIWNNIMNETFGLAESRYKASAEAKVKIDEKKKAIMALAKSMTLDEILDSEQLQDHISDAWKGVNREQMLIRKMKNNAVKKFPKNFGSSMASEDYSELDENYQAAQDEAARNANKDVVDITPTGQELPAEHTTNPEPEADQEPVKEPEVVKPHLKQDGMKAKDAKTATPAEARQPMLGEPGF